MKHQVSPEVKRVLVRIHSAIDDAMGDTDPDVHGMSRSDIRLEEPLLWAAQELARLIGPAPWDKYFKKGGK